MAIYCNVYGKYSTSKIYCLDLGLNQRKREVGYESEKKIDKSKTLGLQNFVNSLYGLCEPQSLGIKSAKIVAKLFA